MDDKETEAEADALRLTYHGQIAELQNALRGLRTSIWQALPECVKATLDKQRDK